MSIIGSDNRQVITSFGTFPYSTVAAVDILLASDNYFGTGIVIAPNHVLTAAHTAYNTERNRKADALRTTISANLSKLSSRSINESNKNVTNVNFLANYDKTEAFGDDIALLTTSKTLIL